MGTFLPAFATFMGIIGNSGYVMQIMKILKRKSAKDISKIFFWIMSLNVVVWVYYGITIRNIPVIATNTIASMGSITILVLSYIYGEKHSKEVVEE